MLVHPSRDLNVLRSWPAQYENDCNLLDLNIGSLNIQSYVPELTATTTNPNLGASGSISGRFISFLDLVLVWAEWEFSGAGADGGSGVYRLTLPKLAKPNLTTIDSSITGYGPTVGPAVATRSTTNHFATCVLQNEELLRFGPDQDSTNLAWTSQTPFAWASGDSASISALYFSNLVFAP